jgi:hypothetical protein
MIEQRKPLSIAGLILVALFCVACNAPTVTPQLVQVKGVLIDATTNQPVLGADLQLWRLTGRVVDGYEVSSDTEPVSETQTDRTGAFLFTGVPPARYRLIGTYEAHYTSGTERAYLNLLWSPVIFEVMTEPLIDLGIVQNCRHTVCGTYYRSTPWWNSTPRPGQ